MPNYEKKTLRARRIKPDVAGTLFPNPSRDGDADPTTVEGLRDRLSETYAAIKALDEQRARLNELVNRDELALRLAMGLPIDRNGGLPY